MLSKIENLYKYTNARMILGDNISNEFEINTGVKQEDPLSSLLFNVDMCDLCTQLNQNKVSDPPHIRDIKVSCLFWADDIVLISKSKTGLKKNIEILPKYCKEWQMKINTDKTKIIIFIINLERFTREINSLSMTMK